VVGSLKKWLERLQCFLHCRINNHDCGCVDLVQYVQESCLIYFFIIFSSNIISKVQTSRYILEYSVVNFAKGLNEPQRNVKPQTSQKQ